jgi:hypothetical protein
LRENQPSRKHLQHQSPKSHFPRIAGRLKMFHANTLRDPEKLVLTVKRLVAAKGKYLSGQA